MKVFRYDAKAQHFSGSNVKPEPWLHIGILDDGRYAIWVWDTRQIVGTGTGCKAWPGVKAADNHQPLKGKNAEAFVFSQGRGGAKVSDDSKCILMSISTGFNDDRMIGYPTRGFKLMPIASPADIARLSQNSSERDSPAFIFNPKMLDCKVGDDKTTWSEREGGGDYVFDAGYFLDLDNKEQQKYLAEFCKDLPTWSERSKFVGKKVYGLCSETSSDFGGKPGNDWPAKTSNGYTDNQKVITLPVK